VAALQPEHEINTAIEPRPLTASREETKELSTTTNRVKIRSPKKPQKKARIRAVAGSWLVESCATSNGKRGRKRHLMPRPKRLVPKTSQGWAGYSQYIGCARPGDNKLIGSARVDATVLQKSAKRGGGRQGGGEFGRGGKKPTPPMGGENVRKWPLPKGETGQETRLNRGEEGRDRG